MTPNQPTLWIIAGPNGVGKTTYAFRHIRAVSGTARFLNLDEIARGLSPLDPGAGQRRAARVLLTLIDEMIAERHSFSIETTLSGQAQLHVIAQAREAGFRTVLLFFAVPSVEICLARVARRVSEGGHDVPEVDVRRRFERSLANLPAYLDQVDLWRVFDNGAGRPEVVMEGRRGCIAVKSESRTLPAQLTTTLDSLPPCAEEAL